MQKSLTQKWRARVLTLSLSANGLYLAGNTVWGKGLAVGALAAFAFAFIIAVGEVIHGETN